MILVLIYNFNWNNYNMPQMCRKNNKKNIWKNKDILCVNGMRYMFSYCNSLTILDLSNFNTQNVNDMSGMFSNCNSLAILDLSNFSSQNVIYMSGMFFNCNSLKVENIITKDYKILKEIFLTNPKNYNI